MREAAVRQAEEAHARAEEERSRAEQERERAIEMAQRLAEEERQKMEQERQNAQRALEAAQRARDEAAKAAKSLDLRGRFVEDVTMPDGTEVTPGTTFTKIWRLANTGASEWPLGTKLVFVGGDEMNCASITPMATVAAGNSADMSADLRAPEVEGRYCGYWRLRTPCGTPFGPRVWVDIVVAGDAAPTVSTTATAPVSLPVSIPAVSVSPSVSVPEPAVSISTPVSPAPTTSYPSVIYPAPAATAISNENQAMVEMGFANVELNQVMLQKHNNNLQAAITELLGH